MRSQPLLPRRCVAVATLSIVIGGKHVSAQSSAQDDPWPSLAAQIFPDRPIGDGSAILAIDAPYRAEDAAVVPIALHLLGLGSDNRPIKSVTLVIDQNPSPVAAQFTFGDNSGTRNISTRVRIDSYTKIQAVAAMADGSLVASERFVKAAGGCSAPAAKQENDSIPLGAMRLRQFAKASDPDRREVQLMVRHPNYTGMQMDQITRLYVPAHFITSIQIWQGDDLLLDIKSGISISENPEFRFDYRPNGSSAFRAEVKDNEGKMFAESWSVTRA